MFKLNTLLTSLAVTVVFLDLGPGHALARKWTNTQGQTQEAKFVRYADGQVWLQIGMKVRPYSFWTFCEQDREYVKQRVVEEEVKKLPFREWTSASGRHTIKARLARIESDQVHLRYMTGEVKRIDIELLSKEDQTHIAALRQQLLPAEMLQPSSQQTLPGYAAPRAGGVQRGVGGQRMPGNPPGGPPTPPAIVPSSKDLPCNNNDVQVIDLGVFENKHAWCHPAYRTEQLAIYGGAINKFVREEINKAVTGTYDGLPRPRGEFETEEAYRKRIAELNAKTEAQHEKLLNTLKSVYAFGYHCQPKLKVTASKYDIDTGVFPEISIAWSNPRCKILTEDGPAPCELAGGQELQLAQQVALKRDGIVFRNVPVPVETAQQIRSDPARYQAVVVLCVDGRQGEMREPRSGKMVRTFSCHEYPVFVAVYDTAVGGDQGRVVVSCQLDQVDSCTKFLDRIAVSDSPARIAMNRWYFGAISPRAPDHLHAGDVRHFGRVVERDEASVAFRVEFTIPDDATNTDEAVFLDEPLVKEFPVSSVKILQQVPSDQRENAGMVDIDEFTYRADMRNLVLLSHPALHTEQSLPFCLHHDPRKPRTDRFNRMIAFVTGAVMDEGPNKNLIDAIQAGEQSIIWSDFARGVVDSCYYTRNLDDLDIEWDVSYGPVQPAPKANDDVWQRARVKATVSNSRRYSARVWVYYGYRIPKEGSIPKGGRIPDGPLVPSDLKWAGYTECESFTIADVPGASSQQLDLVLDFRPTDIPEEARFDVCLRTDAQANARCRAVDLARSAKHLGRMSQVYEALRALAQRDASGIQQQLQEVLSEAVLPTDERSPRSRVRSAPDVMAKLAAARRMHEETQVLAAQYALMFE